jgi:hypothetical protein
VVAVDVLVTVLVDVWVEVVVDAAVMETDPLEAPGAKRVMPTQMATGVLVVIPGQAPAAMAATVKAPVHAPLKLLNVVAPIIVCVPDALPSP